MMVMVQLCHIKEKNVLENVFEDHLFIVENE